MAVLYSFSYFFPFLIVLATLNYIYRCTNSTELYYTLENFYLVPILKRMHSCFQCEIINFMTKFLVKEYRKLKWINDAHEVKVGAESEKYTKFYMRESNLSVNLKKKILWDIDGTKKKCLCYSYGSLTCGVKMLVSF